jgi:hypothetical protein
MLYRLSYSLGNNLTEAGNGSNGGDVPQAAETPQEAEQAARLDRETRRPKKCPREDLNLHPVTWTRT